MYSRFIDNKQIIEEQSGFVKRNHGVSFYWLLIVFIATSGLICLPIYFLANAPYQLILIGITLVLMTVLCMVIYYILEKNNQIIHLVELQNALFSGAARLATEFCIILKHDGSVVYVDPQYNAKFFHLKNQGVDDFTALCESGNLSINARHKLLTALKEGRPDQIEFTIATPEQHLQSMALSIDPIGIYSNQELNRKLNLAIHPITRPSGYFFLRAKKITIEEEYHECLNTFNLGYFSLDANNNFTGVNKPFMELTGYDRDELLGGMAPFETIFYEESIRTLLTQHKSFQGKVDILTKTALTKTLLFSYITVCDPNNGNIVKHGIICPVRIDEIAPKLSSYTKTHLDSLEDSPLPTIIFNSDGKILERNNAFETFISKIALSSELTKESLNLLNLVTDNQIQDLQETLKFISTQQTTHDPIDVPFRGKDERIASLYLSTLHTEEDGTTRFIGHLVDTTELKNLELRFVHSQKMQAIGQLAGGIAHDFNNLLTAMMGFCDLLLLKHPAGDQSFPDIMQIKQNANRAANLVRQLLAFSRKQTLQPKVINITNALADLSNLIRRLIGENLTLNMVHGRDLGHVKVDQGQLEQVIINLAVNARDAMPEGGTLTIRTNNVTIDSARSHITKDMTPPAVDEQIEPGEYILIEVSDTGTGIRPDVLSKVFEPFFSTKSVGSGTGLGLATVYGIIKQTSGYIYVSSKLNEGTHFYIFLKKLSQDIQTDLTELDEEEPNKVEGIDLTGKGNVLLVEDETPVRIFSCTALRNKGYNVLEADCAETALEIIEKKGDSIDIIITDVVMPGMNGPTMVKQIYKSYPNMPVIFVSGYGEDEFIKSFGQERSFNFLSKPYTLKQLALRVKEILEKKE